jgi:hypothetical protein
MDNTYGLEMQLRKFSPDKLEALKAIFDLSKPYFTTTTISGALNLDAQDLGARISSLTRTKINGEPLLLPVTRSKEDGLVWEFNPIIGPYSEISKIFDKFWDEIQKIKGSIDK